MWPVQKKGIWHQYVVVVVVVVTGGGAVMVEWGLRQRHAWPARAHAGGVHGERQQRAG
jgi:hypothetical protein